MLVVARHIFWSHGAFRVERVFDASMQWPCLTTACVHRRAVFPEVEFRGLGIRLAERVLEAVVSWPYLPPDLRTVIVLLLLAFNLVGCHAAEDEPCFGCIGRISFGVFFLPILGPRDNGPSVCFFYRLR